MGACARLAQPAIQESGEVRRVSLIFALCAHTLILDLVVRLYRHHRMHGRCLEAVSFVDFKLWRACLEFLAMPIHLGWLHVQACTHTCMSPCCAMHVCVQVDCTIFA